MKRLIFLVMGVVISSSSGFAWNIFPNLGDERVGTASMQFLKLGAGARAAAMGNSVIAVVDDGFSLYWNSARLVWSDNRQLALAHNNWVVDIYYDFIGYSMKIGDDQAIGVSVVSLSTGKMDVTDEYHPYGTGEKFGFADMAVGLSYSRRLTEYFSFGSTVKYAQENLENLTMRGFLLDLGTFYQTDFRRTCFAVTLTNFGPQLKPSGSYIYTNPTGEEITKSYQSFSPPTTFRIAMAMDLLTYSDNRWQASLQLDHPTDNAESFSLGTEYALSEMIFARAGYKINNDTQSYSVGFGLKFGFLSTESMLDYAFSTVGDLGNSNTFSFNWRF